ncbi:MAG TPA: PAS domain S-box protein [Desulfobacteraceae bacterium]|nr:PAS domain S-box protein [Desulfobacteraceae bacterium]
MILVNLDGNAEQNQEVFPLGSVQIAANPLKEEKAMALPAKKTFLPFIILLLVLFIAASVNFNAVSHFFLRTVHPLDTNHLLIGLTTALFTAILIASLLVLDQKTIKEKEFKLSSLVEADSFFRLLSEKSSDMIHLNDHTGLILYVNPVTTDLLGYERDEIINKPTADFIHPDDRQNVRKDMQRVALGEEVIAPREIRLLKKNSSWLDVEVKGFALDISGEKKYIGAILRDISNRKKNEQLLQAQEEWEQTFNTLTDFVSVHDRKFRIIKANRSLCEFLGKGPEEILGKYCYQLFHERDSPHDGCPQQKSGETGHAVSEIINDPHIGFPLQITCSPFIDAAGEFQGSVHIARIIDPADRQIRHRKKMIPVCASCKDIREDNGQWTRIELFFMDKFNVRFTHSLCRDCQQKLYSEYINP